ncbi:TonB-dependent receptor [Eilatimonas milleporae]|nr:TonB-dependent receptor [Eilatimonas milleporae]
MLPALSVVTSVIAQDTGSSEPHGSSKDSGLTDVETIAVTARPLTGQTIGSIEPDFSIGQAEMRTFGAHSIDELIEALAPQLDSTSGPPIVLVNGLRVSGFREIRSYPTEAIARVEVLPEEVALRYGYAAGSKIINIVLRPRFRSVTAELTGSTTTEGGAETAGFNASLLVIRSKMRWSLAVEASLENELFESERDIVNDDSAQLFSTSGNISAVSPDTEIDSALSALVGQPIFVAAVPAGASNSAPTLDDFVATAGQPDFLDPAVFRTLAPRQETVSVDASLFRPLGDKTSLSISAGIDASWQESRLGLPAFTLTLPAANPFSPFAGDTSLSRSLGTDPLDRDRRDLTTEAASVINGADGALRWSLTARYRREESTSQTERGVDVSRAQSFVNAGDGSFNPFGAIENAAEINREFSEAITDTIEADGLVQTNLFRLPAGAVSASIRAGYSSQQQSSDFETLTDSRRIALSRDEMSARSSIDFPMLASGGVVGGLSLSLNAEVSDLSDFGTIRGWGSGLNWRPARSVRLLLSYRRDERAPTVFQLGAPEIITPAVRTFDFMTGQTVFVTTKDGGNSDLVAESRENFRAALNIDPLPHADLGLTIEYRYRQTTDAVAALPTATAEIRDAFSERFTVDPNGTLIAVDQRAITLARTVNERVRWGLDYSVPLAAAPPPAGLLAQRRAAAESEATQDKANGQTRMGGGRRRRGAAGGRIQFSLYHSVQLSDTALIAPGVPVLDFLNGSAAGAFGGTPRHLIDARIGFSHQGFGTRLSFNWRSGTNVTGNGNLDNLQFSSLATADLRIFLDMNRRFAFVRSLPFLRGARLSLEARNMFDDKLSVTDRTGATPDRYQADNIDPVGRLVMLRFRKMFR